MRTISAKAAALAVTAMIAMPVPASLSAQELQPAASQPTAAQTATDENINVYGSLPDDLSGLTAGPELEGYISQRRGREMQVTTPGGNATNVLIADSTDIRARGGFLGLGRTELGMDALLNGIPVTVETVQWEGGLVASRVRFSDDDLETAEMIRGATDQRFSENEMAIEENAIATEALRGRVANIDQYNVRGTENVYFETGKWNLTPAGERALCETAAQAEQMDNALLLVVGYTDNVGDYEYNQTLSERRAGRVVNHLQQACGWQPWRMLTPTGMAEADPTADNSTEAGRAQNRRVAVNILVSKAVDNM